MFTYQIISIILSVLAIILGIYQYKKDSFNTFVFALWTIVWIVICFVTLFPGVTTQFAHLFGLGRGLDTIYIISILFLFYIVFKLYNKMEQQKKRINELVSELALKENEE